MKTEQIMAAVEHYRTAGGREEHHAYKDQLEAAIGALVQERDELKVNRDEYQQAADKLAWECKTLRDALGDAERYRWIRSMAPTDWLHHHLNIFNKRNAAFDVAVDAARAALQGETT